MNKFTISLQGVTNYKVRLEIYSTPSHLGTPHRLRKAG